ncbi:peptidylprolyl isomerase [Symbiobacterium terraclitae]|uniref:peptidylprolyl isomerase n=1 Tax=Symbiobacterium terraclitae TaxID=557451 RepID=UPI0035B563F6
MASSSGGRMTTALAVAATLVIAGVGGYFLGSRTAQPGTGAEVVATVNGEKITQAELYEQLVDGYGSQVLENMILARLVNQEAAKAGVQVTDAEFEAELAKVKASFGGDLAYEQTIRQYFGMSDAQFRDYLRMQMTATRVLEKQLAPDDATLKQHFDQQQASEETRQIMARHILVATEEEAREIKAQLDGGADFATLARAKSTDPGSAENGGDLGMFGKGAMVEAFEQAAFALGDGQISEPVQSSYGWHIIQVTIPDFERDKEKIREQYVNEKVNERFTPWLTELRQNAHVTNKLG